METYSEFFDRINSFEKRELRLGNGRFNVNASVSQKVGSDNSFRPFYGDTVVFDLDSSIKTTINKIIDKLYETAPECFCERLGESTLHMTLHDLSSSCNAIDVEESLSCNKLKAAKIFDKIKPRETIRMKSKYIFNMVGTSLVLGLYPADENEYRKLMRLYRVFDNVVELGYPFTPHITLAYYNVNGFDVDAAEKLQNTVNELNLLSMEIELNTALLRYQRFYSMNNYKNVLKTQL